ncbi:MAG: AMP-binding protein [Desulfomonilaceae bacterium]|nr:AMP-binding protein [Desulfomonilaceae bacterium]
MLDYTGLTIAQALKKAAEEWGDRECVASFNQQLSWTELFDTACRLATGLQGIGIKKGDSVATIFGSVPEWIYTKYALHILGAVVVPVNINFRAAEIKYVLKQADVKVLILTDKLPQGNYLEILKEINPAIVSCGNAEIQSRELPLLKRLVCFSSEGQKYPSCVDFTELMKASVGYEPGKIEALLSQGRPDDICNILFTSGSTAVPKGAMHNHQSLLGIGAHLMGKTFLLEPSHRLLGYLPFYHIAGCVCHTLGALTSGCFTFVHPFLPDEVLRIIQDQRINFFSGFDAHFNAIATHPRLREFDVSSIDRILLATGPAWYDRCQEIFPNAKIVSHQYGFTEGTGVSCMPDVTDYEKRKFTNGKPWPGIQVKVVNPATGVELPSYEPGELCLSGWSRFQRYCKNEEETRKAIDQDGYFHSGDYGWKDEDGFIVYRGRFKMMIKTGGENVSEREVEIFLEGISGIKSVQVIGVPDEKWGEAVTAIIESETGIDLTKEKVLEHCQGKLAKFKIPKHLLFIKESEWPLLGVGKVDKRTLKKWALDQLEIKDM